MKDYCLELVSKKTGSDVKLNIMREYLQAYVLRVMHDDGFFRRAAFLGGTALRFLYDLPRYSEDLDFSLSDEKGYAFDASMKKIKQELTLAGYAVGMSYSDDKTVHSAMIKFEKLMFEAGLSPMASQKFSIKIDVDTRPPAGAILKTDVANKYFPITFMSYDVPSLFAGKIHALLSRKYTKGRDFFDLGWYLSRWKGLVPNMALLRNALIQTGWPHDMPTEGTWRVLLAGVVKNTDWNKIKEDVGSFLENPADLKVFTQENVLQLIEVSE
jgi:predicted nucleotidyltransferase component of viral defense system